MILDLLKVGTCGFKEPPPPPPPKKFKNRYIQKRITADKHSKIMKMIEAGTRVTVISYEVGVSVDVIFRMKRGSW